MRRERTRVRLRVHELVLGQARGEERVVARPARRAIPALMPAAWRATTRRTAARAMRARPGVELRARQVLRALRASQRRGEVSRSAKAQPIAEW
jgi:hypothetical protein